MAGDLSLPWFVANMATFSNNAEFAALVGKRVLLATHADAETLAKLEAAGVASVVALQETPDRIGSDLLRKALKLHESGSFERIFLDMRQLDEADLVGALPSIFAELRRLLARGGAVFGSFKVGMNDRAFDVQNMLVRGEAGWLPGREYLFDSLLKGWAIRSMGGSQVIGAQTELVPMRLTPKKRTILLICGRSMSGKTTLARELVQLNPRMHVSNDFIYTQLVRAAKRSEDSGLDPELVTHLGNGSGQACGNFNRALEDVPGLIEKYLPHLLACIPTGMDLVSIDFDLRKQAGIDQVKSLLTKAGFSVWLVQR